MDGELDKRLAIVEARVTKLDALVSMQNGLIAAIVEALPNRVDVIRTFIQSAELLPLVMGRRRFTRVEMEAFEEARDRLLATLDFPKGMPPTMN